MADLQEYLDLPYTVILRRDNEGDFVARIEELRGCAAHGKTRQEALENLDEAKKLWIQDCVENGDPVPLPAQDESLPSGKWLQRVPRKLHRNLQTLARRESVSLNQYVTALLAEAVGERRAQSEPTCRLSEHESSIRDWGHTLDYFLKQDVEPLPSQWQLVDKTCPMEHVYFRGSLGAILARLTSKLPNQSVGPLKEKKDAAKKHASFAGR